MRRIALLTDYGMRDAYVAAMKGVIASHCNARCEDLTHEIAPHDIWEAAWFLRSAARWWPEGTIFVCVVDPGVGSDRKLLAAVNSGHFYLAPDNGLLTFAHLSLVVSVENESLFLPGGSRTFHGRDRFAPVAAAIVNGTALGELGPPLMDIVRLDYTPPEYGETVQGTIVGIDRFGNCVTDVERSRLRGDPILLRSGAVTIDRVSSTYSGAGAFMITGSNGTVEISMAQRSAAASLHLQRGDRVEITT